MLIKACPCESRGVEECHRRGVRLEPAGNAAAPTSWPTCSPECPSVPNPGVATMVRTIYQQLSPAEVHGQLDRVVEQLREPFAQVAELLADAAPDILAWTHGLPSGPLAEAVVQQPAGTAEPGDKAPQSLPPKGDVVGIFPNRLSARRLVGAVLAEQHDEWAEARRYLTIPNAAGNEALPDAQYAGRSGLINIKRDDALLHYLTGHYPPLRR